MPKNTASRMVTFVRRERVVGVEDIPPVYAFHAMDAA
jgi:hypothetical protein